MKGKTISTRWREWAEKEPFWAYTALICFFLSMVGLTVHLWVLSGPVRQWGLIALIGFDCGTLAITGWRKQWWWFSFFSAITICVIVWELASLLFGGA